jgi:hypothetical protein
MVLNTMNQLNNISLQSVGEDCVISEGLKRILVLGMLQNYTVYNTFYGYIFLLFILGTNQNLSLVFFKNKQITKHIQKTKNNKNATALMYSKFINNLEQTMDH